jgi:hypothetical protein
VKRKNQMRTILISSTNKTVTEEHTTALTLEYLQSKVGGLIQIATELPNGDTLYVDEEGLLKQKDDFFELEGAHQPFAGDGVLVGSTDDEGRDTEVKSTLEEIKALVSFTDVYELSRRYA